MPSSQHDYLFMITTPTNHKITIFVPALVRAYSTINYYNSGSYKDASVNTWGQIKTDGETKLANLNAVYENGVDITATSKLILYYR